MRSTVKSHSYLYLTGQKSTTSVSMTGDLTDLFPDKVSIFKSIYDQPNTIPLGVWIRWCIGGCSSAHIVKKIRSTGDNSLKKGLPLITTGALCNGGRKASNVIRRTGWVALDIDHQDNLHLSGPDEMMRILKGISNVAYAGLSASGHGVWALIKVKDPGKLSEHFRSLQYDFKKLNLILDPTKGKNPNDPRYYSYDPNGWVNPDYKEYTKLIPLAIQNPSPSSKYTTTSVDELKEILDWVKTNRIDFAPDYDTYLRVGLAIAHKFQEEGRNIFHQLICYSPKYDEREADQQYDSCLNANKGLITLGTIWHIYNNLRI